MDNDRLEFGDWAGRCVGTLIVMVFLAVATGSYYFADGYFSAQSALFHEALQEVRELGVPETVVPGGEGALVHVMGDAMVADKAVDPVLGVGAYAVCIHRDVRYYQWREEEPDNRRNDNESVRQPVYERRWVESPIDSSGFELVSPQRRNFVVADISSGRFPAGRTMLGGYELSDAVMRSFPNPRPLPITLGADGVAAIESAFFPGERGRGMVHIFGNEVYFGADPGHPSIGDVRVTVSAAWPGRVSVVAKVSGGRLDEFVAENGERLAMVREGETGAGRMLGGAAFWVKAGQWGIRVGFGAAFFLLFFLWAQIFFGEGWGMGYIGLAVACLVMGVVWFLHRPGELAGVFFLPAAAAALGLWVRSTGTEAE